MGVNQGKHDIIDDLKEPFDVKYYHFPKNIKNYVDGSAIVMKRDTELNMSDEEYFTQLVTEKLNAKGRYTNEKPKRPNEAIDTLVYANASVGIYKMINRRKRKLDLDSLAKMGAKLGIVKTEVAKRRRRRIYSKGIG